jgi:hypothetical protein
VGQTVDGICITVSLFDQWVSDDANLVSTYHLRALDLGMQVHGIANAPHPTPPPTAPPQFCLYGALFDLFLPPPPHLIIILPSLDINILLMTMIFD